MAQQLELGLDTFGDVTVDAKGDPLPAGQVIRNVVEEGVLADQLGVDFFGVGEHHRADYAISAPEIVLAALAARTERIHLGTAVTVLSSDDPVRVFERFATLDALSHGRGEIILGRGSFTESFPLFGYDLAQYEVLFEEKIELLAQLLTEKPVTWSGTTRAGLTEQEVYPEDRVGLAPHLGRRRRKPGVRRPRGALRPPARARHHRGRAGALRALRRAVPPSARPVRHGAICRSPCTRPATSRRPISRRSTSCGRTTRR